ncbi:glycosyltransferase [Pseudomonas sp. FP597]|uniref:glycosyltransferase n=1 Tax=Pseudomonas sp. FP597 TaxID=2954096 RepID=UPI00273776D4|nr:glycosyltransferase [Pseudomonas sp. FP597]WLI05164.1 glycosyltransferase [Pseudomonas sp. FP597]
MTDESSHFELSVLLVTYNHELYIERALDSLFSQDFSGAIELVVADDASSDATLKRIQRYEGRDARFTFKYLSPVANLGITRNYQRGFSACLGRYVAVLEGDDYWSSPYKLTRQARFLDQHWECGLCSVNYFVFNEDDASFVSRVKRSDGYRLLTARDLISDNLVGNFSTCLYRKSALETLPAELFDITSYDWIVNICVARNSLIGFIEEPMSVYRVHSRGAWSNVARIEQLEQQLSLIPEYDQLTRQLFHASFAKLQRRLRKAVLLSRRGQSLGTVARALAWSATNLEQFIPPVVVIVLKGLTPPVVKKIFLKIIRRGGGI